MLMLYVHNKELTLHLKVALKVTNQTIIEVIASKFHDNTGILSSCFLHIGLLRCFKGHQMSSNNNPTVITAPNRVELPWTTHTNLRTQGEVCQ